jgi:hypothetical protein
MARPHLVAMFFTVLVGVCLVISAYVPREGERICGFQPPTFVLLVGVGIGSIALFIEVWMSYREKHLQ